MHLYLKQQAFELCENYPTNFVKSLGNTLEIVEKRLF